MPNERTTLKKAVDEYLQGLAKRRAPVWFFKVAGGPFQKVGIPDFIGCVSGMFVAIELKHPTDQNSKPSRIQRYVAGLIIRAGGQFFVCRSVESVKDAITNVTRSSV